jgi:phosphatidate cytidylyltransferase
MSPSSKWNDLVPRVLSAIVLTAIAVAALWFGKQSFTIFVAFCSGLMVWEIATISNSEKYRAYIVGLVAAAWLLLPANWIILSIVPLLGLAVVVAFFAQKERVLSGVLAGAVLLGGLGLIRSYSSGGIDFILGIIGIVVLTDIAGYLVGRLVGGPKFWPAISPKKTWSGILGGWAASGLFVWLVSPFGMPDRALEMVGFAIVVSFLSQMGDISESLLKRRVGVKDSSNLIPGHGGFLDRFDGVTAAGLVSLILFAGV